jgi:chromosome segregation ATPase
LTDDLKNHDGFLTGKEAEVAQKTSGILDKVTSINEAMKNSKSWEKDIANYAETLKTNAEATRKLADDAGEKAKKIEETKIKSEENASETSTTLKKAVDEVEAAKTKANQSKSYFDAAQVNVGELVKTIQNSHNTAVRQREEINRISTAAGEQQTEITTKLQTFKTEEQVLKGERERAKLDLKEINDIIKTVEDKKVDVSAKLHKLLDEKPSLDVADGWMLILASRVLIALVSAIAILLLGLVVALIFLARSLRNRQAAGA